MWKTVALFILVAVLVGILAVAMYPALARTGEEIRTPQDVATLGAKALLDGALAEDSKAWSLLAPGLQKILGQGRGIFRDVQVYSRLNVVEWQEPVEIEMTPQKATLSVPFRFVWNDIYQDGSVYVSLRQIEGEWRITGMVIYLPRDVERALREASK